MGFLYLTMSDLYVHSGAVTALRLFDVAYSIDLKRVEEIWSARFPESAVRSALHSTPADGLCLCANRTSSRGRVNGAGSCEAPGMVTAQDNVLAL